MRWVWIILSAVGLALVSIGCLWFLQGSDVVHIKPVLCTANCKPIVGHHPAWQLSGALAVLAGSVVVTASLRRLRRASRRSPQRTSRSR